MCPAVHFVLFLNDFLLFTAVRIIPTLKLRSGVQVAPEKKKKELKKMVTSEELDMTFRMVGNGFGFENVDTEFSAGTRIEILGI